MISSIRIPVELKEVNISGSKEILGTKELSDFVVLYFSACESYEKAMSDGKIGFDDLLLLGSVSVNLFAALNGISMALAEVLDLSDAEIIEMTKIAEEFELGSNKNRYIQVLKEVLYKFQTFSIFK